MEQFLDAMMSVLETATLNPGSRLVLFISLVLGLLIAWFAFGKTVNALKIPMNEGMRPLIAFAGLMLLPLITAALTKIYIAPGMSNTELSLYAPLIVSVLTLPLLAAPLACFLMKAKYGQTLASFLVPLLAVGMVFFLVKGISGAIKQGDKGFITTKQRTEGVNQVLDP